MDQIDEKIIEILKQEGLATSNKIRIELEKENVSLNRDNVMEKLGELKALNKVDYRTTGNKKIVKLWELIE